MHQCMNARVSICNCRFLQFVSKMSKGELIFEDNKVVERSGPGAAVAAAASDWASEFNQHQGLHQHGEAGPSATGAAAAAWMDEFARQHQEQAGAPAMAGMRSNNADWADEFAKGVANFR